MSRIVVGIGEFRASADPEAVFVTHSLGSCVALILFDPVLHVGGILHAQLPLSRVAVDRARECPGLFADTGALALLQAVFDLGGRRSRLIAKVAGGAQMYPDPVGFDIGRRNYRVLRKVLWKNEILVTAEAVGGDSSRSIRLSLATGEVILRTDGGEEPL